MLSYSLGFTNFIPFLIVTIFFFRVVCRWLIFKKMDLRPWLSLIPIVSEYKIFKRCWKAWPFVVLISLTLAFGLTVQLAPYFDVDMMIPPFIRSRFMILALICMMVINVTMYKHLAFAFGHDIGYLAGLLLLNPVFLGLLAFSKDTFHEELVVLSGRELKEYTLKNRTLLNRLLSTVFAVAIVFAALGYIGYVMYTEQQPAFLVNRSIDAIYDKTAGKVSGTGKVIYPAEEAGGAAGAAEDSDVRALYFPDKSGVKETTVYMYLIGSNLEDSNGSASVNLAQIIDATKEGDSLRFVIEAGGSGRWFTDGIKDRKAGRYLIQNGEVIPLETLPGGTCMSKPKTLEDFLLWANENYPSDRKMLFFWDHGGGLAGFGVDELNPRPDREMLSLSDISGALEAAGEQYDLVAFDACLMQTMEVAECIEPYADYMLASEEREPSTGMYYTAAFSRLAQEPTLDTTKFGAMMCSSYDQSLELLKGFPQAGSTMSMTDLRYIPVVEETFLGYLDSLDDKFRSDRNSFINMSTARSKSYEFQMEDQIDLIDFVRQSNIPTDQKKEMIGKISQAIVVRNAASADHINGLAVYMPYDDLNSYTNNYETMETLDMQSEVKVYNDFASIIGSQKTNKDGEYKGNYENEAWYVDDFKNYDISLFRQDIPLVPSGHEYEINLTDEEWETIIGFEQGLRMKEGNWYADLGSDVSFEKDEEGHYVLDFDGTWVAINDVVVALDPGTPKEVEDGKMVYSGTVDAILNFMEPISIYIEWIDSEKHGKKGVVQGYLPADEDSDDVDEKGMPRGLKQFKASNVVTFLYDWYDLDGNYLATAGGHLPVRVGLDGLQVTRVDISSEEYDYFGILQDVLNRTMETKKMHHEPHRK